MPTYLVHGFRWPRPLIRIHIILNNLDDAAAEWLMAPDTTRALKDDLMLQNPTIMEHIPDIQFVEQYDPDDESAGAKSQPYAYVADIVHEVRLGIEVDEVRGKGVGNEAWGAMVDLRDKLAPGEKIAWFVVICGDTDRSFVSTVRTLETSGGLYRNDKVGGDASRSDVTITSRNDLGSSPRDERKKNRLVSLFSSRNGSVKSTARQQSKTTIAKP